jgi:hypothetical protein
VYLASEGWFLECAGFEQAALGVQLHLLVGSVVPVGRSQFLFLPILPPLYVLAVFFTGLSLCFLFCLRLPCVGVLCLFQSIHVKNLLLVVLINYFTVQIGNFSSYSVRARPCSVTFSRQTGFYCRIIQVNKISCVELSQRSLTIVQSLVSLVRFPVGLLHSFVV